MCPARPIISREDLNEQGHNVYIIESMKEYMKVNRNIQIISTAATLPCPRELQCFSFDSQSECEKCLGGLKTDRKTSDAIVYKADPCAQT